MPAGHGQVFIIIFISAPPQIPPSPHSAPMVQAERCKSRTAVRALTARLTRGLLISDSPQGRMRLGVPLPALRIYFPALWPEAEADPGEWVERFKLRAYCVLLCDFLRC